MSFDLPRSVDRTQAAMALRVSTRTISRLVGKAHINENQSIPFMALCKAVKTDPAWLASVFRGKDRAASIAEAAVAMGLDERRLTKTAYESRLVRPAAFLGRGWLYSAKALGIFNPAVSPLAGGPDSNVLCPKGWECSS